MVNTKKPKIKYIDLCSGIGGFRIGLESIDNIETECLLSADIKQEAIDTYNLNFKESNKIIDIYTLKNEDIESFDFIMCRGFHVNRSVQQDKKKDFQIKEEV